MDHSPTYEQVLPCALRCEYLIWKSHEGISLGLEHENSRELFAFYPNQQGHTIEECVKLQARICHLIAIGNIPHLLGWKRILTYDKLETNEHSQFICHYFKLFKKKMLEIYSDLVQTRILASIHENGKALNPFGVEIWKPYAYHNSTYHCLSIFLSLRYDIEALVNIGKIRIEFVPGD